MRLCTVLVANENTLNENKNLNLTLFPLLLIIHSLFLNCVATHELLFINVFFLRSHWFTCDRRFFYEMKTSFRKPIFNNWMTRNRERKKTNENSFAVLLQFFFECSFVAQYSNIDAYSTLPSFCLSFYVCLMLRAQTISKQTSKSLEKNEDEFRSVNNEILFFHHTSREYEYLNQLELTYTRLLQLPKFLCFLLTFFLLFVEFLFFVCLCIQEFRIAWACERFWEDH